MQAEKKKKTEGIDSDSILMILMRIEKKKKDQ
jgi:hypothetical protein